MAIKTLFDFWTDRKAAADLAASNAQDTVTLAQGTLATARTQLSAGNVDLANLLQATAAIRAAMAAAATPADVDALKPQLVKAIAGSRAKQAQLVELEAAVDAAQTALDVANADVVLATARDNAVNAALADATQAQTSRQKLRAVAAAPMKTMPTDATTALGAKPFTDAKARIEADLPQELRDCAAERANVILKRLDNDARLVKEAATTAGKAGTFAVADQVFRDYGVNAKNRFDQAIALATRVADPLQNPLTAAERAEIHNPTLLAQRIAAANACKDVATAQIDVDSKQTDLDIARLHAEQTDIDADPEADAAVTSAKAKLKTATDNLAAKEAVLTPIQKDLTDWIGAVPDSAWRNLADFSEAQRLLTQLTADPTTLETDLDAAEAALVTALSTSDKSARAAEALQLETLGVAARARFDTGSLERRIFGALQSAA
jgi:hypothetical protein